MLPEGALSPVNGVLSPNNCCKHNFTEALEYCKIQLPGSRVSEADGHRGTRGLRDGISDKKGLEALGTALQAYR